jgi:hypothetical protein
VPWQLGLPDPCDAEVGLRGDGRMQGRAQVSAGDAGDHWVGGARGTIAGHARCYVLRFADGAEVVDERVATDAARWIETAPISENNRRKICYGNATALFGLPR